MNSIGATSAGVGLTRGQPSNRYLIERGVAIERGPLRGVEVHPCVSQGARPIGPEMTITAGEDNVIRELASDQPVERAAMEGAMQTLRDEAQEIAKLG